MQLLLLLKKSCHLKKLWSWNPYDTLRKLYRRHRCTSSDPLQPPLPTLLLSPTLPSQCSCCICCHCQCSCCICCHCQCRCCWNCSRCAAAAAAVVIAADAAAHAEQKHLPPLLLLLLPLLLPLLPPLLLLLLLLPLPPLPLPLLPSLLYLYAAYNIHPRPCGPSFFILFHILPSTTLQELHVESTARAPCASQRSTTKLSRQRFTSTHSLNKIINKL